MKFEPIKEKGHLVRVESKSRSQAFTEGTRALVNEGSKSMPKGLLNLLNSLQVWLPTRFEPRSCAFVRASI